jgi:hypothetical protein
MLCLPISLLADEVAHEGMNGGATLRFFVVKTKAKASRHFLYASCTQMCRGMDGQAKRGSIPNPKHSPPVQDRIMATDLFT